MNITIAEEKREEKERLVVATTKVVEYLQPFMSKELLCKFPDNSAFDFDYTQSSIWSPLVTRAYSPMDLDLDFDFDFMTPRKLSFGMDFGKENKLKKVSSNIKKNICTTAFKVNLNLLKMKSKKKMKASEFSPTPIKNTCYPATTKAWAKMLKAASKHFKRKKKDSTAYVKRSIYLRGGKTFQDD
ncbi:uncharacterized protein LOC132182917 [Corylus avellana]|uniref:uncharacterized protein LOC132182917 n=1 Tax=Corylus avellana TaxID=13451 RepID=UPI001E22B832|nr:uncharacterized protein LOC132182917 [Corylus avellana]